MMWEASFVLGLIGVVIVLLYLEVFRPAYTLFFATVILVCFNVLEPGDALRGFSNEQLAVIIFLLIVSSILQKSSLIDKGFKSVLNKNDSPRRFLFKMTSGIGVLSAIFNNTPLVAMMMPYVFKWSKDNKLPVSKFLIPLSYASILGGCITLVGTSTNLLVNGLAEEVAKENKYDFQGLDMFDFSIVGLPMLIIGIIFLVFFSGYFLPKNKDRLEDITNTSRKFFFETRVEDSSSIIGVSVEDAGLRNLSGSFLVEVLRDGKYIRPVSSQEIIEKDDILFFAGSAESISSLHDPSLGISLPKTAELGELNSDNVAEIVISNNSRLSGVSVKNSEFRGRFDGAILAIHRNGERVWGQLGDIVLKPGDVLLVMMGKDFAKLTEDNPSFYVLSKTDKSSEVSVSRLVLLLLGMLTAIGLHALNILPLFTSLILLIGIALALKLTNPLEMLRSIDFNLVLVFALGLSLGTAMKKSGAQDLIIEGIMYCTDGMGAFGLLSVMFVVTNILSALITTQAAVAITTPISMSVAFALHVPIEPFVLIIAFAAAANFLTPIGYQTNLMVYGPGGYKFRDFFKVGLPITILYAVISVLILSYWYNLI